MKLTISAIRRKDQPSKFGGVWTVVQVKFDGVENPKYGYDLKGFQKDYVAKLKEGDKIEGYISKGSYTGKNGIVETNYFNKITAEYVYGLLLKINPNIETSLAKSSAPSPMIAKAETSVEYPSDENEEDPGF